MRLKLVILILITLTVLSGCQSQSTSTTMLPLIKPSITGLNSLEIDQTTADSIRQSMGLFLKSNPYTEYETGSQLLLYLVSSGEFGQAEIVLASGETYQADVLYAYTLMTSQRVLVAPVLVGYNCRMAAMFTSPRNILSKSNGGVTTTRTDRKTALADALMRLPRGRIFRVLAYGMVTRQGLDWKKCPSASIYPPEICPVGKQIEQLYPKQTKNFVLRLADEFPTNWLLVGWVFDEFTHDELVPGASIDVPLPELSQP